MVKPAKTKTIKVNDNEYVISFPNNRGLMNIYARKAQLAKEMQDSMSFSMDGNAKYVAMLIDAVATFETVMPEQFFKDLNITSIGELDALVGAQLVKVYRDQYETWFNEWTAAIASVLNPTKEENKAQDNKDAA